MRLTHLTVLLFTPALVAAAPPKRPPPPASSQASEPTGVDLLHREAAALRPLFKSELVRQFLGATETLPRINRRVLYRNPKTNAYHTKIDAARIAPGDRKQLIPVAVDEQVYYTTRYGTPLAYSRPLELLADAGLTDVAGKRILDYGYGSVGHLRLLAALGADAVGVDVDPFLHALYSHPSDAGAVKGTSGRDGRVTLLSGSFPSDEATKKAVGGEYDLFISKNTLKNGYIHPAQTVDPRMLVHLGVSEKTFVKTLFEILRPGGIALIYNICPAPAKPGEKYIPWADGNCPFPKPMWEQAGFQVIAFDQDDGPACRAMAHALGWDAGDRPMDLKKDLFAHYTLVRKSVSK